MPHRIERFETADATYGLRDRFSGTYAVKQAHDDAPVVVFDGDTHLELLELDWRYLDKQLGITEDDVALGVVVTGNLTIDRAIMNWEMDYGPFLYVKGSVTAGDVGAGGSEIEIEGSLTVQRTVFGFYNHGRILVHRDVTAEALVVEEHLLDIRGNATATVATQRNFLRIAGQRAIVHLIDSRSYAGFRELDPAIFDIDDWTRLTREDDIDVNTARLKRGKILKTQDAGRSILRGDTPWPVPVFVPRDDDE